MEVMCIYKNREQLKQWENTIASYSYYELALFAVETVMSEIFSFIWEKHGKYHELGQLLLSLFLNTFINTQKKLQT
jgi:hypothetical protein